MIFNYPPPVIFNKSVQTFTKYLSVSCFIIIAFSSCKKDSSLNIDDEPPIDVTSSIVDSSTSTVDCAEVFGQVTKIDDKLKVTDTQHFINLCNCLDGIKDNFDDTVPVFNDDQPIIDFENELAFSSLRAKVEAKTVLWENATVLDNTPNPDDEYLAPVSLMAILNEDCEMYIGDELANACDNPEFTIRNVNYGDLDGEVETRNGVCFASNCCTWATESQNFVFPNNNRRRIRLTTYSIGLPWPFFTSGNGSIVGGKIRSERQRNNGRWRRSRQQIAILGSGGIYRNYISSNCNILKVDNNFPQSFRNRRSRDQNKMYWDLTFSTRPGFAQFELCTSGAVRNVMDRFVCNIAP